MYLLISIMAMYMREILGLVFRTNDTYLLYLLEALDSERSNK